MKICKIIIKDFHQFKDFELDLTDPKTGKPLDKICLIGSNGTGKTKILKRLIKLFWEVDAPDNYQPNLMFVKYYDANDQERWLVELYKCRWIIREPTNITDWKEIVYRILMRTNAPHIQEITAILNSFTLNFIDSSHGTERLIDFLHLNLTFVPAETEQNLAFNITDVPNTSLDEALKIKDIPQFHVVSNETIAEFWKTLIYHLKKRDSDFQNFQNLAENQNRTVRQVREEFDEANPLILNEIAKLWNEILDKAGLKFDAAGASNPIQLTDNLKAYIKLKSTGERINYNDLSTGIRNFIFKVGHIYSLYFNQKIESGLLLIDEPENSLFPDFLYDLVDIYRNITHNTQIFMATHSPIIAAQFEPYERFILEFDDDGYVQARRGTVPVGDDPNDILSKDFGVRSLLGKEGVKKWERYIELRTMIRLSQNSTEKGRLLDEFMHIGNEYNFSNALS